MTMCELLGMSALHPTDVNQSVALLRPRGGELGPHAATMPIMATFRWVALGFLIFFALEQFLHWHHCHRAFAECKKPLTYLILIGDGLHNQEGQREPRVARGYGRSQRAT
jgi:hypothetical protein